MGRRRPHFFSREPGTNRTLGSLHPKGASACTLGFSTDPRSFSTITTVLFSLPPARKVICSSLPKEATRKDQQGGKVEWHKHDSPGLPAVNATAGTILIVSCVTTCRWLIADSFRAKNLFTRTLNPLCPGYSTANKSWTRQILSVPL